MPPRIAIVHDYLVDSGGAERVVLALHEQFPDAPIYTSVHDRHTTFPAINTLDIRTSFLQRLPVRKGNYKFLLPFYPVAFESLDLSGYDIVISSCSSFAKGVITGPDTLHICYCYTPPRFAWRYHEYTAQEQLGTLQRLLISTLVHPLRTWDFAAAQRVDHFVAISGITARRIWKDYRRESTIIAPPVDVDRFEPSAEIGDYYLIVSRLAPYKRIDLAVEAFNHLQLPLKVVGAGADAARLRAMANRNIEFLGHLEESRLAELYAHSRAVIFPGVEDFGIVPLEANAAGRPVIAFAAGGALETVKERITGVFFREATADALARAVSATDVMAFDAQVMRHHALQYGKACFKERIAGFVQSKWNEQQSQGPQVSPTE